MQFEGRAPVAAQAISIIAWSSSRNFHGPASLLPLILFGMKTERPCWFCWLACANDAGNRHAR